MGTALVIGGSRGIGRAIALKLASSGFDSWLTFHSNEAAAKEVQSEIEALGRGLRLGVGVVFNSGIIRDNLMGWMTKEKWDTVDY